MITPEEFTEQMKTISKNCDILYDAEIAHVSADALMMETLGSLGYSEGVKIFEDMPKWYA